MRNVSTQNKEKFIQGKIIFSFSFSISVKQSRNLLYCNAICMHSKCGTRWRMRQPSSGQREYSSKPLKHSIVKRILVFKR